MCSAVLTEKFSLQCEEIKKYESNLDLDKLKEQEKSLVNVIGSIDGEIENYDVQLNSITQKRRALTEEVDEKRRTLDNLKQAISEAESTYTKLVESSQTLLAFMKKEASEVEKNLTHSKAQNVNQIQQYKQVSTAPLKHRPTNQQTLTAENLQKKNHIKTTLERQREIN